MTSVRPLPPALRAPLAPDSERWMGALPWTPPEAELAWLASTPPSRVLALPAGKLMLFRDGRPTGIAIPILGYLLEAPGARFVVDCGLGPRWRGARPVAAGSSSGGAPEPGSAAEVESEGDPELRYRPVLDGPTLAEQAAALGFRPDRLVCTHLHLDHAGGARELALPVEAGVAEWAAAADASGYPDEDLGDLRRAEIALDPGRPLGPFAGATRLAPGVLALDTAGHTPGSISLLIRLEAGPALIVGDAVYPRLEEPASPAYHGMLRIRRLLRHLDVEVLAAHDTAVQRATAGGHWL